MRHLFPLLGLGLGLVLVGCGPSTPVIPDSGPPDTGVPDDSGIDTGVDAKPPVTPTNKLDLLLMIDNSASMGDKQDLLAAALPDLVGALIPKVGDIHIGIVTSSLGGGGATDICDPNAKIGANEAPALTQFSRHNDDKGHLINRKKPDYNNPPANGIEDPVQDAVPKNFLAWMPNGDPNLFTADFGALVTGAGVYGCGLEAQMESWYRFLVQPDPYDSIQLDTNKTPAAATLVGVDATILQQRHDFLRPDSLLAVIAVTDEEDSWSDPMWLGGRGWLTRAQNNTYSTTGQLPKGTQICATNPADANCQWCAFNGTQNDPNCAVNKGLYGPKEDGLNVRYMDDMKRRYGMNPQFPIDRYVDGLKSATVPDRVGEHTDANNMVQPNYVGRKNCTNPIFAATLPTDPTGELCKLTAGSRPPEHVFFGVIGGVPWQLVPAGKLADADWTKIVGKDPGNFDQTGIDPHMIESITPRAGISCGVNSPNNCDPFNGREYDTLSSKVGIDLEYACIFTLPKAKDCTKLPEGGQCDCGGSYTGPLCDPNPNDGNNLTLQTRGKAYPTIRELRVARALGDSGVIGSLCPKSLDMNNPDYGYRPFVRELTARIVPMLKQ